MKPQLSELRRTLPTPSARFLFCLVVVVTSVGFSPIVIAEETVSRNKAVIKEVFDRFKLLPMQRVVIRDYMLSGKDGVLVDHLGTFNDKELFILRDAKTKEYVGEVNMKMKPDGQVEVDRLTGGQLNYSSSVKLPVKSPDQISDEAETALSGTVALKQFETEKSKPELAVSLPAVKIEGNADFGGVVQSKAYFNSDGSGYEYGLTSSIASAEAGGRVGLDVKGTPNDNTGYVGAQISAGAKGPGAGVYVNYFGKPDVDEKGEFSRMVIGGASSLSATLAEVEAKFGCDDREGCASKFSMGALGVGGGFNLKYGSAVKIESYSEQAAGTPESITPQEEAEYSNLVSTGDVSKMKQYVDDHPTAAFSDELENIIAAKETHKISQY